MTDSGCLSDSLDWTNQPKTFKEYPGITPLSLSREIQIPKGKLSAILGATSAPGVPGEMNLETLSLLLLLSYTHTARTRDPGGSFIFRSAASAGALYPTELYVALRDVKGVDNGLYHFAIQNHSLDPVRRGDVPGIILGERSHSAFFLTAIFFRSAWKYRARAYRYHLLDTGHVAENLTIALKASKLPFSVTYDFDDAEVNRLLGLDDQKEAALAIIDVPGGKWISERYKGPLPTLPGTHAASQPRISKGNRLPHCEGNPSGRLSSPSVQKPERRCSTSWGSVPKYGHLKKLPDLGLRAPITLTRCSAVDPDVTS